MPFRTPLALAYRGVGTYELTDPLVYAGARDTLTVPAGFTTDLASVPRPVRWLLPQDGPWTTAAVLHDYCCTRLAAGDATVSSRDADGLFRRCAREAGVRLLARWLLWTGVRLGALANPRRRPGITRDLPAMALLAILALPLVAPPSIVVALALGLYALAETFLSGAARLIGELHG